MTWECIGGSATLADMMIDTEADPYNMDFDTIIGPDGVRWGEGCTQDTLLLTKMDRCGKMNWNIPLENPCLIIIAILFFKVPIVRYVQLHDFKIRSFDARM